MNLADKLDSYLESLSTGQLLPFFWAGLGALVCFFLMVWLIIKWKKRYRDLLAEHNSYREKIDLESRFKEEKIDLLQKTGDLMRLQFRNLAQEIFDEKTQILTRQNSEKIEHLLKPYQEQLSGFRDRIETIFLEESRDHSSLKQELLNLRELNDRINEEAVRLSRAISGDNRQQGTWGEILLARVLEQSGLRNGYEFETQSALRDDTNRLYRPDVIIHLPDGKDIVIDSKVSLTGWTKFVNGESESDRQDGLTQHIRSIRSHVKSLSQKDYSSLKGVRSLDFVLMFIPIEGAFSAAIQKEEKLLSEMYARKVIIVTPTTLLATLRMVEYFWQHERQNRNAVEIAERAGSLYNKLRGFLADMEKLGQQLDNCRDSYDRALNKLSQGRGNLISQAARFPDLGVKVKEELSPMMADTDK
ncbi:MAG: DNA recombination protein RmuC [Desulfofustis sp.]|jgi:DNA recombination protein RmuC